MTNVAKTIACVTLLLLIVTSCKAPVSTPSAEPLPDRRIERYIDLEAGVVCWTLNYEYDQGGISCLPIEQTKLGK